MTFRKEFTALSNLKLTLSLSNRSLWRKTLNSPVEVFADDAPAAAAAQRDEGEERVGEEEAEYEAEEVRVVVDPGEEAGQEEHGRHAHHLEQRHLGVLEARPLVDHLHHAARQQAEVPARGADLFECPYVFDKMCRFSHQG